MDYWPRYINGGVWIPLLYLLAVYPGYILLIMYLTTTGSGIMDNFLDSIGNVEILISAAVAVFVIAAVIYYMLHNEYAKTKKKKYADQLAALKAGAEVDQLVLDHYAAFDRTYTFVMVPSILIGAVLTEVGIIGLSCVWPAFSLLAVDICAAAIIGAVVGLCLEKFCQAVAGGYGDEKYTDRILAKMEEFRQAAAPAAPADPAEALTTDELLASLLSKLGKSKE